MKRVLLKIGGMTCSACSSGLEKYLNKQDGIKIASVNLVMNNAAIEYDDEKISLEDVEKFVSKAGFESLGIDTFENEEKKSSIEINKVIVLAVISGLILYISMSHMVGLPQIPFVDMSIYPLNYALILLVLTIITLYIGRDILKNGYKNLIHKTPNMDTLVTIGVVSSVIYSLFSTFKIFIGETMYAEKLYYESAALIIFFIKIGKYIEGRNKDKTKEALQELMTITPNSATILIDGKEKSVTIDEIQKGDIVVCKPGEKIAVDGTIISGITHINESFITGESTPVKREKGSKVIAGSINFEGAIQYEAEKIGRDSTVSEIVRMVAEATSTKAPISRIADKISGIFVPIVIFLAVLTFVAWIIISKDISIALNSFVTVLVVACPCSLGLATPLAIVIASGICTKRGILVKSSEALENAHKVKTIVLDKTGTITQGRLSISKLYNYSNLDDDTLLDNVASIESKSEHPIAKAIVDKAKNIREISEFKAIPGYGITGILDNEEYIIGNMKLMEENHIEVNVKEDFEKLISDGNSILFVACNKKLMALIGVKDIIKDNIKDVINKIKRNGINVVMLTGDNEKTAKVIANEVGIDSVISNVLPTEKAEIIKKLKKDGMVMMCGDGINDSISLVTADIGVSVSSGTDIAMDSSNIVIMNDNLDRINELIKISYKTVRNIKQNLFWAFIYNICMIPIAMGLFTNLGINMNPMFGALAMILSSLTVVLNVLRLKKMEGK
ncbi:MAG: heavy metal translocating P-type ATPase [Clostridia bacterium]